MRIGLPAILAILFCSANPQFCLGQEAVFGQPESLPGIVPESTPRRNSSNQREPIVPEYFGQNAQTDSGMVVLGEEQLDHIPKGMQIPGVELESGVLGIEENYEFFSIPKYSIYRSSESMFSYLPADANQLGWLSLKSSPNLGRNTRAGITGMINFHFLSGPTSIALPPRLYDFAIGYQKRGSFSEVFSYDIAASVGVFSDFADSARDGIRYPGHAVGMIHLNLNADFVFGVDYISRDDIKLLPVVGFSWHNPSNPRWRADVVFPRPRIEYALNNSHRIYLASLLDGGSWDIEFPDDSNDVMTYSDIKILFGVERNDQFGNARAWEFGYVFDRYLQFRSRPDKEFFDDAFVLRIVSRH